MDSCERRSSGVNESNAPEELHAATAARDLARRSVLLVRAVTLVASRSRAVVALALVDLQPAHDQLPVPFYLTSLR